MASDYEDDSDLEALRSAVLASLKSQRPKQTNSVYVKNERGRNDTELEELRVAALHSKRPQDEMIHASILSQPRFPPSRGFRRDFGHLHKGLNRNNLIVIQPLPLEESIQQEPTLSSLKERVQPVPLSSSSSPPQPPSSVPSFLSKPFGRYIGATDEEASQSPRQQKTKSSGKFSRFESDSESDSSSESDYSDSEESNKSPESTAESNRKSECSDDEDNENSDSSDILLLHPDEPLQDNEPPLANDQDDQNSIENGVAATVSDMNDAAVDSVIDVTNTNTDHKDKIEERKQPHYRENRKSNCDGELGAVGLLEKDSRRQSKEKEFAKNREDNRRDARTSKIGMKSSSDVSSDRASHKRQSDWEHRMSRISHGKDSDRKYMSSHGQDVVSKHGRSKRSITREQGRRKDSEDPAGNTVLKDVDAIGLKVPSKEKTKPSKEEIQKRPNKVPRDPQNARLASREVRNRQRTKSLSPFCKDLREKLKSHSRKCVIDKSHDEAHECDRPNSRNSSVERSRSRSPIVKSVLKVVKVNSRERTRPRRSSKRSKRKKDLSVFTPTSVEVDDNVKSFSPMKCEFDKSPRERKVLLVKGKSFSDDDRVSERTRLNITFTEDIDGVSSKQRLPVHLRLGDLPKSTNSDTKIAVSDSLLKAHHSDRGYRSSSPSFASKTSSSKRMRLSDNEVDLPRKVKLRRDAFHSSKSLMTSSKTNGFASKTSKSRSGKTYENELDEKIRRIRARNQAILQRKCEIEQDEQVNSR